MNTELSAVAWINSSLFGPDSYFSPSRFESVVTVCSANLCGDKLAEISDQNGAGGLSAFEGRLRYSTVIRELVRLGNQERAYLFYLTDPDNCMSILNWVREYRYEWGLDEVVLQFVKEPTAQGGAARLGILACDGQWMLLHEFFHDEELLISLHGPRSLRVELASAIGWSAAA